MQQPLVSILMPFRNTEAYLPQCLDSIQSQQFDHWELLAVNDGSADGSLQRMEQAAAGDGRIRVFENPGTGIIPALREAYRRSSGVFITRMDSDDCMAPGRLKVMAEALQKHGPGHVALGQVRYFSDRGISDGYARYERWLNDLTATGANFQEIYKECVIPSPCWMVWREDLHRAGAFSPDVYPEDYDLCFRFYREGLTCLPSENILHYWRDYDARTSRNSEHYAQNYFLELKTRYFLELDWDPNRPLVVWGAGFKGKKVARLLQRAKAPFLWVCDNPNKIGKKIYGQPLESYHILDGLTAPQSLITVANAKAQAEIRRFLQEVRGQRPMRDFYFFC